MLLRLSERLPRILRTTFPAMPRPLTGTADQWEDIAAKERAASPPVPVAESVDLGAAEKEVAADEELLASAEAASSVSTIPVATAPTTAPATTAPATTTPTP